VLGADNELPSQQLRPNDLSGEDGYWRALAKFVARSPA
jgi:hypothetical protein